MARPELKDETVGELLGELTRGTTEIVRKEVQLARAELEQNARRAIRAAIWLALALGPLSMAMVLIPLAIVWGFDEWTDRWVPAIVGAGVMLAVTGVFALVALSKLRTVSPKPERTLDELEEEKEWLKTRIGSSARSMKSGTTWTMSSTS